MVVWNNPSNCESGWNHQVCSLDFFSNINSHNSSWQLRALDRWLVDDAGTSPVRFRCSDHIRSNVRPIQMWFSVSFFYIFLQKLEKQWASQKMLNYISNIPNLVVPKAHQIVFGVFLSGWGWIKAQQCGAWQEIHRTVWIWHFQTQRFATRNFPMKAAFVGSVNHFFRNKFIQYMNPILTKLFEHGWTIVRIFGMISKHGNHKQSSVFTGNDSCYLSLGMGQQLKNWVPVAKRFGTVARWQCMAMVSRKTLIFVCWRIIYRWTLKETCDISCKMVELDMANREIQIWVGQSYTITRLLCDISDDYYTTWWFPKMGVPPNHPF